jgi:chromosomal replication initiator protein
MKHGSVPTVADPKIATIQEAVAGRRNVRLIDMRSHRCARPLVRARWIAMLLARELTAASFPAIGRHFGNRDHTTIMHGVRRIEELCRDDAGLAADVESLRAQLMGAANG